MRFLSITIAFILFAIIEVVLRVTGVRFGGLPTVVILVICQFTTDRLIYRTWKSHKAKKEIEALHPNVKNNKER